VIFFCSFDKTWKKTYLTADNAFITRFYYCYENCILRNIIVKILNILRLKKNSIKWLIHNFVMMEQFPVRVVIYLVKRLKCAIAPVFSILLAFSFIFCLRIVIVLPRSRLCYDRVFLIVMSYFEGLIHLPVAGKSGKSKHARVRKHSYSWNVKDSNLVCISLGVHSTGRWISMVTMVWQYEAYLSCSYLEAGSGTI